jgi:hypothetical protein
MVSAREHYLAYNFSGPKSHSPGLYPQRFPAPTCGPIRQLSDSALLTGHLKAKLTQIWGMFVYFTLMEDAEKMYRGNARWPRKCMQILKSA